MLILGAISKRLGRPLLGLVVAYAVAAQSLFIAFGGFVQTAPADVGAPGLELCLHDGQAAPDSSGNTPSHPGCTHCIFCFAGSHHALIGSPPVLVYRLNVEFVDVPRVSDRHALPRVSAYAIARPRGPPLSA
jgi:hypothetical protein